MIDHGITTHALIVKKKLLQMFVIDYMRNKILLQIDGISYARDEKHAQIDFYTTPR